MMYLKRNTTVRRAVGLGALAALLICPVLARAGEEKPDYKPFDEVTKGYELIEGFFPLYYNAKTDNLLAVIPQGMIGQDFLMAQSIASGGRYTGYQFGHTLVRWEEFNKKLMLIEPDSRQIDNAGSTLSDVIDRTYTDSVLLATPIVTKRGGDPVIDLDAIFKRDFSQLGRMFGGSMDASLSKWSKKKNFPDNTELAVEAVYMGGNGGSKATVHYSISRLPKTDYRPREADDRIGYFLTARQDWTTDHNAKTTFKRLIHRWHLRKAEPDKEVSDVHPDDQIVFYIEKTVPVKYRRYIREGILMWNKAFEKAGIRNAVEVRQQTDSNEFAHLDPEDVNYNFFRWIVSGRSFAMGPSRANPITGEILDADIIMDDSMARVWYDRYGRLLAEGPAAYEDEQLDAFLGAHPEWRYQSYAEKVMPGLHEAHEPMRGFELPAGKIFDNAHAHGMCTYANGVAHEMCLGTAILEAVAEPGVGRDEFVGQWIKLVACHEVGHTLGLRHNFKASAWKSMAEILANNDPDVPTTASVMDYNPAVYNLDRSKRKVYVNQSVGPYDELAIAYGYRVPGKGESEEDMLAKIAGQLAEQGLDFATDENSGFLSPDPLVNVYDHSSNPVEYAAYRMDLVDNLRKDMTDWAIEDGESYDRLRRTFDMLLFEYSRVTRFATRMIGGQYMHRHHKGDPNARPPIEVVPAAEQRAALTFLTERVFSEDAFKFEPEQLQLLAPGRWSHWGSDAYDSVEEYPLHDRIAAIQYWVLFGVTNPVTVGRVHDATLQVPADQEAVTVASLIGEVTNAVWSELDDGPGEQAYTARASYIGSMRRGLQRNHLRLLTRMVMAPENGPYPADAIAVARMTLQSLGEKIDKVSSAENLDPLCRAHLIDARTRIAKALDAGYNL